jgi:hypothetical protein
MASLTPIANLAYCLAARYIRQLPRAEIPKGLRMKIRKVASTLMLSLVLIPGEGSGQSRELKTVRVAIIGGQVPLPIAIGQAHGFFEKFGVRVTAETMWTSGTPGRGSPRGNMTLPTLGSDADAVCGDEDQ